MGRPRPKAKPRPVGKPRTPKKKVTPRKAKSTATSRPAKQSDDPRPRLQKVLASAGVASRRDCEELIVEGRVEIDGKVADKLGVRVDPDTQEIRLDGNVLRLPRKFYYLVNKPSGVVSTTDDPRRRMRVIDLVPKNTRLFTVGRLDKSSEGLMLVTNDGELANRLAHPRYGIEKTYLVTVAGLPDAEALKRLRKGIHLAEGSVRVTGLRVKQRKKQSTVLEMVLTEGRNREIRRMAAAIGHKVIGLVRIGLGPLRLGTMPTGAYREVESRELKRLRGLVDGTTRKPGARKKRAQRDTGKSGASKSKSARGDAKTNTKPGARKKAATKGRSTSRPAGKKVKKKTTRRTSSRGKARKP